MAGHGEAAERTTGRGGRGFAAVLVLGPPPHPARTREEASATVETVAAPALRVVPDPADMPAYR